MHNMQEADVNALVRERGNVKPCTVIQLGNRHASVRVRGRIITAPTYKLFVVPIEKGYRFLDCIIIPTGNPALPKYFVYQIETVGETLPENPYDTANTLLDAKRIAVKLFREKMAQKLSNTTAEQSVVC